MSDEFGNNIEDLDEEMEIITMIDDETEEEIEFVVIDRKKMNDTEYILVIESKDIDDDEAEAAILKVVSESEDDITYAVKTTRSLRLPQAFLRAKTTKWNIKIHTHGSLKGDSD